MCLVRPPLAYCSCALFFLAAVQPAKLMAQASRFEGKTVVNILFDPPEQPLTNSEIAQMLPLQRGEPLHMSTVRASIERLYATRRYEDIQVDAEPSDGGV